MIRDYENKAIDSSSYNNKTIGGTMQVIILKDCHWAQKQIDLAPIKFQAGKTVDIDKDIAASMIKQGFAKIAEKVEKEVQSLEEIEKVEKEVQSLEKIEKVEKEEVKKPKKQTKKKK